MRFDGIPELPNENVTEVISKVCTSKLKCEINNTIIDCCHRLKNTEGGVRSIIVKFCQRTVKQAVYKNKAKLKGSKVIIREYLATKRVQIIKDLQKRFGSKSVWSYEGNIFAKKQDGTFLKIKRGDDLKTISWDLCFPVLCFCLDWSPARTHSFFLVFLTNVLHLTFFCECT